MLLKVHTVAYLREGLAGHGPCQTFKVPALWTSPRPPNLKCISVRLVLFCSEITHIYGSEISIRTKTNSETE